jgi:ATP-binding cassette subfamily B protein
LEERTTKAEEQKKRFSLKDFRKSLGIYRFIKPYRTVFIIGMLFLLGSSVTSLTFPFFTGKLVDAATNKKFDVINTIALSLGGILIIQSVFSFFRMYIFSMVTEKITADMRLKLYQKLTSLSISYFDKHRVGELNSRLTTDVAQLQDMLSTTLAEFFRQIATLVIGIAFILFYSTKLTVFMLSTFPIIVIVALIFGRYIRKLSKSRQDELASANVVVEETLQAIKVVKAFTNELLEIGRYRKSLDKAVKVSLKAARYRAVFVAFIIFALFGGIVLVLWYGARMVLHGELSIGQLTSFIIYTAFIGGAVGGLGDLYSQIQKTIGSSERILEILAEDGETIENPDNSGSFTRFAGDISFKNVNFRYPGRLDVQVLNGINFTIPKGAKIALVGPSGAGKSTIAQLLLNFYSIDSGEIDIDGEPLPSYSIDNLRRNIGIVPQETILFGGTIYENILYGKNTATKEEVTEAAKKANALNFIEGFPDKFETIVGERGIQLSGGQRQRIALARAILKDPAILILDEATSSLDAESERLVQEALDELMKGRTSLIIAHRLSTVKKADSILVINGGEIIEQGSHEDLLKNVDGLYSHLVKMQLS